MIRGEKKDEFSQTDQALGISNEHSRKLTTEVSILAERIGFETPPY